MASKETVALRPVNEGFLDRLETGMHIFHYPRRGDAANSFRESPSAEYTMYSVIAITTGNGIVLTRSFDEKEKKVSYTREDLLEGEWWYNPEVLLS